MFIPSWILILAFGVAGYFLWRRNKRRETQLPPGHMPISPEVDTKEFSRLFAQTLLDEEGRRIFPDLFGAGTGCITWREIMFMKFILGEIDREEMIAEMESHKDDYKHGAASYRDAEALNRQVEVLGSALKPAAPSSSTEPDEGESKG